MKETVCSGSKSNSTNFLKRVLSRTSNHSKTSTEAKKKYMDSEKSQINFESELSLLKKQIDSLQVTVNTMHYETEKKDKAIANLAKEKEQLSIDLKRQKRSNVNLKQQLEDERNFYYKEKEQYCNEMNNYKKMKKQDNFKDSGNEYKKEISHLKNTLNQTLEANYNLSVKFLRMKNTKLSLKKQLGKLQQIYDKTVQEYKSKLDAVQNEMNELVNKQFMKPIPPSNKKYLQVVKQNGSLIHDNLSLQLEVDRLNLEIERMKMLEIRNDTNSKLKYINTNNKGSSKSSKSKSKKTCDTDSVQTLTTKTEISTIDPKTERTESKKSIKKICEETSSRVTVVPIVKEKETEHSSKSPSKFELMTISNSNLSSQNDSEKTFYTSLKYCQTALRTQSAPEVVQTT